VSCAFPRAELALHVEGDLSPAAAAIASSHLATCPDCRQFLEQLRARQALLKSLRRETVSPSECSGMRREVMSIIDARRDRAGWALRIERAIMIGFRRRSYALAAVALLGVVSVSLLAQLRRTAPDAPQSPAVFDGKDTLLRPEGYRDWIVVGPSASSGIEHGAAGATHTARRSVYINPSGYREYAKTGSFPEGTLMVWESMTREPETADRPHNRSPVLLVSVKDSARFDGGWGFFDFTGIDGRITSRAPALVESSGCRACHQQDAETDHVFTQFYPVLRSARQGAQRTEPRESARLTEFLALSRLPRLAQPPLGAHA
jgi:hypothetical protein